MAGRTVVPFGVQRKHTANSTGSACKQRPSKRLMKRKVDDKLLTTTLLPVVFAMSFAGFQAYALANHGLERQTCFVFTWSFGKRAAPRQSLRSTSTWPRYLASAATFRSSKSVKTTAGRKIWSFGRSGGGSVTPRAIRPAHARPRQARGIFATSSSNAPRPSAPIARTPGKKSCLPQSVRASMSRRSRLSLGPAVLLSHWSIRSIKRLFVAHHAVRKKSLQRRFPVSIHGDVNTDFPVVAGFFQFSARAFRDEISSRCRRRRCSASSLSHTPPVSRPR